MKQLIRHILREHTREIGEIKKTTTPEFIEKAKAVHDEKYDYSNVNYKKNSEKVEIICPIHGSFLQSPAAHLKGQGCETCGLEKRNDALRRNVDEFISKANFVHNNKYEYSKVDYKGALKKVIISCPKHGDWEQTPGSHLAGNGCPSCRESKGELKTSEILTKYKIKFIRQKRFIDCTNKPTKGIRCVTLPFDFYLPTLNTIIEYDGQQHYVPVWGEESFKNLQKLDKIRNQYCKKNGIKLIRIPYTMKKEEIEPYILKELGIN